MGQTLVGGNQGGTPVGSWSVGSLMPVNGFLFPRASEPNADVVAPVAGAFSLLEVVGASGSATIISRVNAANGNQSVTDVAPVDLTHSDTVAAQALVCAQLTAQATGDTFGGVYMRFAATSGHAYILATGGSFVTASAGISYTTVGGGPSIATSLTAEALAQLMVGAPGAWANLSVEVVANTATGPSTLGSRINGVDGAQTITVGAGLTGFFQDTAHSDQIQVGDLIAVKINANGGLVTWSNLCSGVIAASGVASDVVANYGNASFNSYFPILGSVVLENDAEAAVQLAHRYAVVASRARINIPTNAGITASVLQLRINGANANQVVTIPAGLTGWFQDLTHSDIIGPNDLVNWQYTNNGASPFLVALTEISALGASVTEAASATDQGVAVARAGVTEAASAADALTTATTMATSVSEAADAQDTISAQIISLIISASASDSAPVTGVASDQ